MLHRRSVASTFIYSSCALLLATLAACGGGGGGSTGGGGNTPVVSPALTFNPDTVRASVLFGAISAEAVSDGEYGCRIATD